MKLAEIRLRRFFAKSIRAMRVTPKLRPAGATLRVTLMEENLHPRAKSHEIPLWRILLGISLLVFILLITSILVCGTNEVCRARLPTLNNLLNSTFVAPFMVTALNSILSLHLFTAMGIYYKTENRIQLICAMAVYVSVVITMFVFPFTNWSQNWANVTIIFTLSIWMLVTLLALRRFYRHRINGRRNMLLWSTCMWVLYVTGSVIYIVLRSLPPETAGAGLLIVEIASGIGLCGFLLSCVGHIWDLTFIIKI